MVLYNSASVWSYQAYIFIDFSYACVGDRFVILFISFDVSDTAIDVCWKRFPTTTMLFNRITGGAGSTDPPNYYYLGQGLGNSIACQLACEAEAGCYAYSYHLSGSADGLSYMCYGISESLVAMQEETRTSSGHRVECGSQASKILLVWL